MFDVCRLQRQSEVLSSKINTPKDSQDTVEESGAQTGGAGAGGKKGASAKGKGKWGKGAAKGSQANGGDETTRSSATPAEKNAGLTSAEGTTKVQAAAAVNKAVAPVVKEEAKVEAVSQGWGVSEEKMVELDWWQSTSFDQVTFTSTPAQHFSGRQALFNISQTLWSSWVVQSADVSFYFSGDSGYDVHYKQIGDKFGPIDLVFIDSGQYNARWREVHNLPEEAVQASIDLKGRYLVPVHWGMFNLAIHNWYDPIQESVRFSKKHNVKLMTPKLGQLISMEEQTLTIDWWSNLIGEIKK